MPSSWLTRRDPTRPDPYGTDQARLDRLNHDLAAGTLRVLYDRSQPRVPAGQGRESGRWTDGGAAGGTGAGLPAPVDAALATWGRAYIREGFSGPLDQHDRDYERGLTLGPDGRLIDTRDGSVDGISYEYSSGPEQTPIEQWPEGSTHVHGHPSSSSFSPVDIYMGLWHNQQAGHLRVQHLVVLGKDGSEARVTFHRTVDSEATANRMFKELTDARMAVHHAAQQAVTADVVARTGQPLSPMTIQSRYTAASLNHLMQWKSKPGWHAHLRQLGEQTGLFTYTYTDATLPEPALVGR